MINHIKDETIYHGRASHYGATSEDVCIVHILYVDAKELNAFKRRKNYDELAELSVISRQNIHSLYGHVGMPYFAKQTMSQKYPRAKNGRIAVKFKYYTTKEQVQNNLNKLAKEA